MAWISSCRAESWSRIWSIAASRPPSRDPIWANSAASPPICPASSAIRASRRLPISLTGLRRSQPPIRRSRSRRGGHGARPSRPRRASRSSSSIDRPGPRALGQRGDLRVAPGDHPRLLLACGLALVQRGAELARQGLGAVPLLAQSSIVRFQFAQAGLDRLASRPGELLDPPPAAGPGRALGQRGDLRVAPGDHPRLLLACGLALVQPGAELARQRRGPVPLLGQPSVVRLQLSRPVLDRRVRRLAVGRLHFQVGKPNSKLLCFRGDLAEPRLQTRPVAGHLIAVLLGPTRGTAEDRARLAPRPGPVPEYRTIHGMIPRSWPRCGPRSRGPWRGTGRSGYPAY